MVVVNGDLTVAVSLAMDGAALALTAGVGRVAVRPRRLLAGAAVGTLPTLAVLFVGPSRPLAVMDLAVTPWLMVGVAFSPRVRRDWIRLAGALYAVTIGLGGVTLALLGAGLPLLAALVLGPGGGLMLVRWWSRVVSRPLQVQRGRAPVRLTANGRRVMLEGLWDSGNRLHTATGIPVLVASLEAVRPLLEPSVRERLERGELKAFPSVRATTVAGSVALPLVNVDVAEVEVNGEWKALIPLVVGVPDSWRNRGPDIQALINPDWIAGRATRYA